MIDFIKHLYGVGGKHNHNSLISLQGGVSGTTGEYYHLTSSGYTSTLSHLDDINNPHHTNLQQITDEGTTTNKQITTSGIIVPDNNTQIINYFDPTKIIGFDASLITSGTTRTLSMADRNIDLDFVGRYFSAGVYTFPTFTDNNDGTITVGNDGVYLLHCTSGWDGCQLEKFSNVSGGTFILPVDSPCYIVVSYNSGSPVMSVITDVYTIQLSDVIPIWTLFNHDNTGVAAKLEWPLALGAVDRHTLRLVRTNRFTVESGGLLLSEAATRIITITSGRTWYGITYLVLPSHRSDTNTCVFSRHVGGIWTSSTITQYNNSQYDNGTNLVSLSPNRYAVNWIYRYVNETDNQSVVVLGNGDYRLSEAIASQPPSLPPGLSNFAILVGRIIIKNGDSTATEIDSAFDINLSFNSFNHNDLNMIQGGTTDEYYHLTATEHGYINQDVKTTASPTFNQIISTASGATAPFQVSSTTKVTNLNADLWDGYSFSDYLDQAVRITDSPEFERITINTTPFNDTDASTKKYVDDYFPIQEDNIFLNDVATLNATTSKHGFAPRLSDNASQYFNGKGNWTIPTGASTNNYSLTSFSEETSVNVVHNFNNYPIVQVIDSSGIIIVIDGSGCTLVHNTVNDFTVTFSVSKSGSILASMGSPQPQSIAEINTDYTVTANDRIIIQNTSGTTITLFDTSGRTGWEFIIDNASAGDINVVGFSSGQTIQNETYQIIPPDSAMNIYCRGSNWRIY